MKNDAQKMMDDYISNAGVNVDEDKILLTKTECEFLMVMYANKKVREFSEISDSLEKFRK